MNRGAELKFDAAILDLDGVVTRTAHLHAKAWGQLWDEFLRERTQAGAAFKPFDLEREYRGLLDGKSREDGIRSFFRSRGIGLSAELIRRLSDRKNEIFNHLLKVEKPDVFEDAIEAIWRWRRRGIKVAIVSSSKNCAEILEFAHLDKLFDVRIDGNYLERHKLRGKPSPDLFDEAARLLHVQPECAIVFEDSIVGIQAARRGRFGKVIGVGRDGNAQALRSAGADDVVQSLNEISLTEVGVQSEDTWKLRYYFYEPKQQPLREALCALGNGYFVIRGAAEEESSGGFHYPGAYLVSGYNRIRTEISGGVLESEDLVNWPNALPLRFRGEGGDWIRIEDLELLEFYQELDLAKGMLSRSYQVKDSLGRVFRLKSRRVVSMALPHLAAISWEISPINWSGKITIQSGMDGAVRNSGVARYKMLNGRHLDMLACGVCRFSDQEEGLFLVAETCESQIRMTLAEKTQVYQNEKRVLPDVQIIEKPDAIYQELALEAKEGTSVQVEKTIAIYTSRDHAIGSPLTAAKRAIARSGRFSDLLNRHELAWHHLWRRCDMELSGNPYEQLILRLYIFHLLQTISTHTLDWDAGVPARGLHGEAYRGHVFWDELFVFPFFNFRIPELSRNLLMYRYRRLEEARYLAAEAGYRGAMYPWQSASAGAEETPSLHINPITGHWLKENTHLQSHVNSAIVYNIWQYYQVTKDREFLSFYGAEVMFEIARFWASRAVYVRERGRYVILGVVGPDEFHTKYPDRETPGIDNNAYTNVMASWAISKALDVLNSMDRERREHLRELLEISEKEMVLWEDVSRRLYVPFQDGGIINEFEGYERLKDFDLESYRKKYGDIQRLDRILESEGAATEEYKVVKQADVLMLFYLFSTEELTQIFSRLGYPFEPSMIPKNIQYYTRYTAHGSTLSRAIHSWVLARSDRRGSWSLFQAALESDFSDIQNGTTGEGIHLGAMAETIDLVQRCYSGMEPRDDVLWLNPRLPDELPSVSFRIRYRGHWLAILITRHLLRVSVERSWHEAAQIGFCGQVYTIQQGDFKEFALDMQRKCA